MKGGPKGPSNTLTMIFNFQTRKFDRLHLNNKKKEFKFFFFFWLRIASAQPSQPTSNYVCHGHHFFHSPPQLGMLSSSLASFTAQAPSKRTSRFIKKKSNAEKTVPISLPPNDQSLHIRSLHSGRHSWATHHVFEQILVLIVDF